MWRNAAQRLTAKFFYLPKSRFEDDKLSPNLHHIGERAKERETRARDHARTARLAKDGQGESLARRKYVIKGMPSDKPQRGHGPDDMHRQPQVWRWQRRSWEQPERAAEREIHFRDLPARMAGKHGPYLFPFITRQAAGVLIPLGRRSATCDHEWLRGFEERKRAASVEPPGPMDPYAAAQAARDRALMQHFQELHRATLKVKKPKVGMGALLEAKPPR